MTRAIACCLALMAAYGDVADAATLGRLFYTPEQRTAIVAARVQGGGGDPDPDADIAIPAVGAMPSTSAPLAIPMRQRITLSGTLDRPRGGTAWFGGTAVDDGGRYADFRVEVRPGHVVLSRATGPRIVLRIGQSLDLLTLAVQGDAGIDIRRRP